MAYNPSLYNPYGQSQPYSLGQPTWPYVPQTTTAQPVNGLVSVTGMDGARAYPMPPNSSMPLFDNDNDLLYVKTTDAAGYPTIKTFRFESAEPVKENIAEADYVSRSEFDELVEQVRKLVEKTARTRRAANDGE